MSEAADRALMEGLLRYYPREMFRQMLAAAEEAARSEEHAPDEIQVRARVRRGRVAEWSVPRWRGW